MTELKPCPFCGDPMEWRKGDYAAHTNPSASCPLATQGFTIITTWNTRAEADTLRAEVARLTAEILVLKRDLFYCFPTEFEYKD
jgi:hypothetical protein